MEQYRYLKNMEYYVCEFRYEKDSDTTFNLIMECFGYNLGYGYPSCARVVYCSCIVESEGDFEFHRGSFIFDRMVSLQLFLNILQCCDDLDHEIIDALLEAQERFVATKGDDRIEFYYLAGDGEDYLSGKGEEDVTDEFLASCRALLYSPIAL
jgi:hypothetical protein